MICYIFILLNIFFYPQKSEANHDLKGSFYYGYVGSNNLAQNKVEKINGNYSNISVNFIGKSLLHNQHSLLYRIGFKTKRHTNDLYVNNYNENIGTLELGNQIRIGKNNIFGIQGHYLNSSGRSVDFQTNSTKGRDSQFRETGAAIIWQRSSSFFKKYLDFTSKAFYLKRDFKTLANDENGNIFKDNYSTKGVELKSKLQITNRVLVQIAPVYKIKSYTHRRSRFTEGTLDNSKKNPFQDLAIWSLENRIDYIANFTKIFLKHNFTFQDDKTFGALDYNGNIFSFGLELPFSSIIALRPMYTIGKHKYESFVANVINDPQSKEKRIDEITSWIIPIEINLTFAKFIFSYQNQKIISNYPLEGFDEVKYELGIRYEL